MVVAHTHIYLYSGAKLPGEWCSSFTGPNRSPLIFTSLNKNVIKNSRGPIIELGPRTTGSWSAVVFLGLEQAWGVDVLG